MTERIYVRGGDGSLVAREGGRTPGGRYSDIGKDPDGFIRMREWTPAENAERDVEETVHAAFKATLRAFGPDEAKAQAALTERLGRLPPEAETPARAMMTRRIRDTQR